MIPPLHPSQAETGSNHSWSRFCDAVFVTLGGLTVYVYVFFLSHFGSMRRLAPMYAFPSSAVSLSLVGSSCHWNPKKKKIQSDTFWEAYCGEERSLLSRPCQSSFQSNTNKCYIAHVGGIAQAPNVSILQSVEQCPRNEQIT